MPRKKIFEKMNLSPSDPVYIGETGFEEQLKGGDRVEDFETLLAAHRGAVERYVRFRLPAAADADDVLQEVWLAAYRRFGQLKNQDAFKAWTLSIARNKCADWFRREAGRPEISLDALPEQDRPNGGDAADERLAVRDALERLDLRDRELLYLCFWEELPRAEIARQLGVPVGTVKSRLHAAKGRFRDQYPCPVSRKGELFMKKLPEYLPDYTIREKNEPPFAVKWEELAGWFLVPRLGEKLSWGMYDIPSRKCSYVYDMEVTGRAEVHGIEGVELTVRKGGCSGKEESPERTFVAQLTDTHCRYLATQTMEDGVRKYVTFLDGEAFLPNWWFGEDNCGNEIHLSPKGDIRRTGAVVTCTDKAFLLDVAGRYTVTIGGRSYDTVCVMDVESHDNGVVTEQFLDRNGRTILWRRFNRDDWAIDRYGKPWSRLLPDNERLTINGRTYVHWYDCITDYIL